MFGRATIRLGIGPHSSITSIFSVYCMFIFVVCRLFSALMLLVGRQEGHLVTQPITDTSDATSLDCGNRFWICNVP